MDIQRVILIVGLIMTSYLLILAWNEDYGKKKPVAIPEEAKITIEQEARNAQDQDLTFTDTEAQTHTEDAYLSPEMQTVTGSAESEIPVVSPSEPDSQTLNVVKVKGKTVRVKTDVLDVELALLGGDIVKASLLKYPVGLDTPDIPFVLIDPRNRYSAQTGLIGPDGTDGASGRPQFTATRYEYDLGDADTLVVELKLQPEPGLLITKRFKFQRSNYLIDIDYQIDNQTSSSWNARMFAQIKRNGQEPALIDESGMGMQPYLGGATFLPDEPYHKLEFEDLSEERFEETVTGGYIAMVQKYFVTAFIPHKNTLESNFQARKLVNKDIYLFGFTSADWNVRAGEKVVQGVRFYMGPKDQYRLEEIATGLDLTIDYGFLWWLAQPLFWLLTHIHSLVNNWGVAIILLTVVVKTLLYPLSATSFRSMAKMRKLQPDMARLKERYGDDKQEFSKAMMDLYKKEGANPLGGCLPILLQMPVFLALYWTLMESVEIRQAPFALWIHDLSALDPYFVLPILMGGSMWLTQSMQPEPPDPIQAKVFKMMPIMFTFFFLWFPSGLVLYWLVNNMLSVLQQWYVTRQIAAEN